MTIATCTTSDLDRVAEVLALMDAAFAGDFSAEDWEHALGGVHALAVIDGRVCAHAAVVPRTLWIDDRPMRGGYVEAVAVLPELQRQGLGTAVMRAIAPAVADYQIGALSTAEHRFYERLGWQRWRGRTWVRTDSGVVRTEEEDDGIMVLTTPLSPALSIDGDIVCRDRLGDAW